MSDECKHYNMKVTPRLVEKPILAITASEHAWPFANVQIIDDVECVDCGAVLRCGEWVKAEPPK